MTKFEKCLVFGLISFFLAVFCFGCAGNPPAGTAAGGKVEARLETIQRIAGERQKATTNPADVQAFNEIYNQSKLAIISEAEMATLIDTLQKQHAKDVSTEKFRDRMIPIAISSGIAGVFCIAAWLYLKPKMLILGAFSAWVDILEYAGGAFEVVAILAVSFYIAIDPLANWAKWAIPLGMSALAGYSVYLFIARRKARAMQTVTTVTELVKSNKAALINPPERALAVMGAIQSDVTKAVVDAVQIADPSLSTPVVPGAV